MFNYNLSILFSLKINFVSIHLFSGAGEVTWKSAKYKGKKKKGNDKNTREQSIISKTKTKTKDEVDV